MTVLVRVNFYWNALRTMGACAIVLALMATGAVAQGAGSGTITGRVLDPQNLAVPGAAVTVRHTDTGAEQQFVTNDAGIYVAPFAQPGRYTIAASKEGFNKIIRAELVLQVGQTLTVDLQ